MKELAGFLVNLIHGNLGYAPEITVCVAGEVAGGIIETGAAGKVFSDYFVSGPVRVDPINVGRAENGYHRGVNRA